MKTRPVVALHGNLGLATDWDALEIPDLIAVDLWDHAGKSFHEMVGWLADEFGGSEPLLLGYSLGGRLALHALALFPKAWAGGVIVSAHPGLPCVEDRLARRVSDEVWARRAREMAWPDFLASWDKQAVLAGGKHSAGRESLESRREQVAQAFENWSLGKQDDLRPSVAGLDLPLCWVAGEKDEKFSALALEMVALSERIEPVIVPDCGHRVPLECPQALAEVVCSFRERLVD